MYRNLVCAVALGPLSSLPAAAQTIAAPVVVQAAATSDDAVERLGRFIRTLTTAPRDVTALLGAGQAALDVGDANAALGFFARAEEVAPTSARAKAGLASSLVQIERPDDALRLFAEAVALGTPEVEIARDRGLAYDLRGDPARAQRDYALAATRGADDELLRRWSLSLGIAGQREAALKKLSPLLYRQDQGAWRARAFIYAMTGDVGGANTVARQLMPPAMAAAMSPLLTRLTTLNSAERAHAVNFGTVPSDGTQLATVRTGDPFLAAITVPQPAPIPGAESKVATVGAGLIPAGRPFGGTPVVTPSLGAQFVAGAALPLPSVAAVTPAPTPVAASSAAPTSTPIVATALPPSQAVSAEAPQVETPVPASAAPVVTATPASRLVGLLEGVTAEAETRVDLPNERELRAARVTARRKVAQLAAAEAEAREAKAKADAEALARRRNPARVWVQIATGNNERGLGTTWRRIREANPKLLGGQSAWSAPFRATNRVLVGPMRSAAAARTLANKLDGAMVWTSEAGEEVSRIGK